MDLQWHIRLIDRLIKNNPEATIKDYYRIVDQAGKSEDQKESIEAIVKDFEKVSKIFEWNRKQYLR